MRYAITLILAASLAVPTPAVAPPAPVVVAQSSPSRVEKPPAVGLNAKRLTRSQTRAIVAEACRDYGIGKRRTRWLQRAAIDIIYDGAHESGGSARAGRHRAGCKGIAQFDSGWHQSKRDRRRAKREGHKHPDGDFRLCARCSLYRMARVYRDGGESAIRRHWSATYRR